MMPERVLTLADEFAKIMGLPAGERLMAMKAATDRNATEMAMSRSILSEIDRSFMGLVADRKVRCFAFESPRTLHSQPVEILPEHWEGLPNWEAGEYRKAGLHLIELRIAATNAIPEGLPHVAPSPAGRPPFGADILEAFETLLSKGILTVKPFSHGIEQIRVWIKEHKPNSKAARSKLSDDAIRKAVKSRLSAITAKNAEKL